MSSKIFKSSYMSDSSRLEIEASIASTSFHITHCTVVGEKSFMFDNTTAPALCLAILEAAGFEDSSSGGRITGARIAVGDLRRHVANLERATAEAKEQAELEAEALVLENARCEALEVGGFNSFDDLPAHKQATGLAVARKAREMRKS